MYKIGILGSGFVGFALEVGLSQLGDKIDLRVHDKFKPETESLHSVVINSEIIFFCLPTPMNEDGSCNTSILEDVLSKVINIAKKKKTFVIKSTVPPGTTKMFSKHYPKHLFVFNPEYLTEANFIQDFLEQNRIVLGYANLNLNTQKRYKNLYKLFEEFTKIQKTKAIIHESSSSEAEMAKYIANCFLATKVTFFNEMKEICDQYKIDYNKAVEITLLDKRIGKSHYTVPGPDGDFGFGGACFSKDLNSLTYFARDIGVDPIVLESIWTKNLLIRNNYDWENLAQVTGEYEDN